MSCFSKVLDVGGVWAKRVKSSLKLEFEMQSLYKLLSTSPGVAAAYSYNHSL